MEDKIREEEGQAQNTKSYVPEIGARLKVRLLLIITLSGNMPHQIRYSEQNSKGPLPSNARLLNAAELRY